MIRTALAISFFLFFAPLAPVIFSQGPPADSADKSSMAPIPGGAIAIGIDTSEIPRYEQTFGINRHELFDPSTPKHSVTLSPFLLDRTLVTNQQFFRFTESHPKWKQQNSSPFLGNGNYLRHWKDGHVPVGFENHPIVNVTWYAAVAYCQSQGKRLPAEAEWEHAARGGENGVFPWGNSPADTSRANYSASNLGTTTPVDKYPPNKYGLFDMAGNVWQFTADEWAPYSASATTNPVAGGDNFASGDSFLKVVTRRVIRGGSWGGAPLNLWVEYRDSHPPNGAQGFVGFRCAKSAN